DQRVDAAERQPEHDQIDPLLGVVAALDQGPNCAAYDDHGDPDAQAPEDDVDEREARKRAQSRNERSASRYISHSIRNLAMLPYTKPCCGDGLEAWMGGRLGRPSATSGRDRH